MNDAEKQILHGLHFNLGVGNAVSISPGEILWLAQAPLPEGKNWRKGNGFRSASVKTGDYLSDESATASAAGKYLSYLQQAGFVSYQAKGAHFELAVTARGADLARELDSRWGRWNLLYKKHKDGLLGLLLTVVVSIVTSILTTEAIWKIWKK